MTERLKVLCVDDEPQILEGLALHLRRSYEVSTATSAREGLDKLDRDGPFAVVLSDMRMPLMNGAAFLAEVRARASDTTRVLLTGYADVDASIAAVNEGQIFRFLTKPCPPERLRLALEAAAKQYQLVTAERVLLEQTLRGAIKALTDILAVASPLAFGRAGRIRRHVCAIADQLPPENRWQVEVAAMLSQLGSVTLPEDTLKKLYYGGVLKPDEEAIVGRLPIVTESVLASIPRLEPVRDILTMSRHPFKRTGAGTATDAAARAASVLRIAVAYDELECRGASAQTALDTMRGREGSYDPSLLQTFAHTRGADESRAIREIPLRGLQVGMVLAEDMRTKTGLLLATRGVEVTSSFLEKTRNYAAGYVVEPLRVVVGEASLRGLKGDR